jgi:hypothetical protein
MCLRHSSLAACSNSTIVPIVQWRCSAPEGHYVNLDEAETQVPIFFSCADNVSLTIITITSPTTQQASSAVAILVMNEAAYDLEEWGLDISLRTSGTIIDQFGGFVSVVSEGALLVQGLASIPAGEASEVSFNFVAPVPFDRAVLNVAFEGFSCAESNASLPLRALSSSTPTHKRERTLVKRIDPVTGFFAKKGIEFVANAAWDYLDGRFNARFFSLLSYRHYN